MTATKVTRSDVIDSKHDFVSVAYCCATFIGGTTTDWECRRCGRAMRTDSQGSISFSGADVLPGAVPPCKPTGARP